MNLRAHSQEARWIQSTSSALIVLYILIFSFHLHLGFTSCLFPSYLSTNIVVLLCSISDFLYFVNLELLPILVTEKHFKERLIYG
jgi:inner membrane protein involved in colicin E2 resistance